jgi:hypothetical protein
LGVHLRARVGVAASRRARSQGRRGPGKTIEGAGGWRGMARHCRIAAVIAVATQVRRV